MRAADTGTGGGLKLFCSGAGADTPDIANASRRIKQAEYDTCKASGVTDIVEVPLQCLDGEEHGVIWQIWSAVWSTCLILDQRPYLADAPLQKHEAHWMQLSRRVSRRWRHAILE